MIGYFTNYWIQRDSLISFGRVRGDFTPTCQPPVQITWATAYVKMPIGWQKHVTEDTNLLHQIVRGAEKGGVSASPVFSPGVTLPCSIRAIFSSWGISTFIKQFKTITAENVICQVWLIQIFSFPKPCWSKDCYEYIICSPSKSYLFGDTHIA